MKYRIFTLHPGLFESFVATSLIARAVSQDVIQIERINWRDDFGIGNYAQVDHKPFGGGSGMVLMPEPIMQALEKCDAVGQFWEKPQPLSKPLDALDNPLEDLATENQLDLHLLPNNSRFERLMARENAPRKVTISLTPRGFPLTQPIAEWISQSFDEVSILCGRYEGFDQRVSEAVDLEISLGDFVLNGGEIAAMALIETTARLVPGFVTKTTSTQHDSFSSHLNSYSEKAEYVHGKRRLADIQKHNHLKYKALIDGKTDFETVPKSSQNTLFSDQHWLRDIVPRIEHPQYTRPEVWRDRKIPGILLSGNHKMVDEWRKNWYQ